MAGEPVIDIIAQLSYKITNDEGLRKAVTALQEQVNQVGVLSKRLASLQQLYDRTSSQEVAKRNRILGLINQQRQAIDQTTASIGKQVQGNKQLQNAITREIGLINTLNLKIKTLTEERNKAIDPKKIQAYNKEIRSLQGEVRKLTGADGGKGGVLGQIGSSLLQGFGIGGGVAIFSQVASFLSRTIDDSSRLAAEAEGVERAFKRLDKPELLDNLRRSTRGTLSDLELMKQAVQFSNFGLPVEQLGIAFDFARKRARDTGQDVDYLVQSIVTGIGRKSPLILDNLGISTERVAQEFKKTGDFAEAAFNIIQEESRKAGIDIDTFAERQAKLNAELENYQVELGKSINLAKERAQNQFFDLFRPGTSIEFEKLYKEQQEANREYEESRVLIKEQSDKLYLSQFQRFATQYTNADQEFRQTLEEAASGFTDAMIADAKRQMRGVNDETKKGLKIRIQAIQEAYATLQKDFTNKKFSFSTFLPQDVNDFTKSTLERFISEGEAEQAFFTPGAIKSGTDVNVLRNKSRLKLLREALSLFKEEKDTENKSLSEIITIAQNSDAYLRELIVKEREVVEKYIDLIKIEQSQGIEVDAEEAKQRNERVNDAQKRIQLLQELRLNEIETSYTKQKTELERLKLKRTELVRSLQGLNENIAPIGGGTDVQIPGTFATRDTSQIAKDTERINKQLYDQLDADLQLRRDWRDAVISIYQDLQQAATTAFNNIYDKRIQLLDLEIDAQRDRVDQAEKLAERGNATILEEERNRLRETQNEREKAAKQQAQTNSFLAASQSLLSAVQAIGAITATASQSGVGSVATIPLVIAAIAGGVSTVLSLISGLDANGFAEGGYTGDGDKYKPVGIVHAGEFVTTKEQTAKYRGILESINNGSFQMPDMSTAYHLNTKAFDNYGLHDKSFDKSLKRLETKLDSLQETFIAYSGVDVRQNIDSNGVAQIVTNAQHNNKRKYR